MRFIECDCCGIIVKESATTFGVIIATTTVHRMLYDACSEECRDAMLGDIERAVLEARSLRAEERRRVIEAHAEGLRVPAHVPATSTEAALHADALDEHNALDAAADTDRELDALESESTDPSASTGPQPAAVIGPHGLIRME